MGKSPRQPTQRGKTRVESSKDHLLKAKEARGPKIKGIMTRRQVLRRAWEIWEFLAWQGQILSEWKYGQTIGTKVVKQATRGLCKLHTGDVNRKVTLSQHLGPSRTCRSFLPSSFATRQIGGLVMSTSSAFLMEHGTNLHSHVSPSGPQWGFFGDSMCRRIRSERHIRE